MADEIKIDIYLNESGGGGTGISTSTTSGNQTDKLEKTRKRLGQYVASKTVGTFINNTKSALSQNIGMITGRKELQERVNFAMSAIQIGEEFKSNAVGTAQLVSTLGGSAVSGAVLGVVLTAVNYGINTAFKAQQLALSENLENQQIKYVNSRLGASYNRSRSNV